ncbi:UNVERIFIED_CONTAM: ATP-binding cassette sub- C member 8 [Siphonaria sp. JEL0065]|nr:ATP-binding cassette sub- C member 8 [Siphonaria sp. JEL0065]
MALLLMAGAYSISNFQKVVGPNDTRVKLIREALDGIHLIKFQSLVGYFIKQINSVRSEQLKYIGGYNYGGTWVGIFAVCITTLMPVASISMYALREGGKLDAGLIFPALSLFQILGAPLINFVVILRDFMTALVSWNRICEYLDTEARKLIAADAELSKKKTSVAVSMVGCSFMWPNSEMDEDADETDCEDIATAFDFHFAPSPHRQCTLNNLKISIKKGSLVMVAGGVGSGKSALLQAILGELELATGEMTVNGSIAYCAQKPWIKSGQIRDNILFGLPFQKDKMNSTLEACSLTADISMMPDGLESVVGEKGTSISGGQKSRIALARAVYNDAEIYLLDDPLAALDAKVSHRVMQDCILYKLKNKTVIMTTHDATLLRYADSVIFIKDSGLVIQGTYSQVIRDKEFGVLSTRSSTKSFAESVVAVHRQVANRVQTEDFGLIVEEYMETGNTKVETYAGYVEACGGKVRMAGLVALTLVYTGLVVLSNQWLTWWIQASFELAVTGWLLWYVAISGIAIVLLVLMNVTICSFAMRSSSAFHANALLGVLQAPLWWFETQLIGRLMNRFTKDITSIDNTVTTIAIKLLSGISWLLSVLALLAINTPVLLVGFIPLSFFYYYVLSYYTRTMRQLKRLEAVQKSPLFAHVSEALEGVTTIVAYKGESRFRQTTAELLQDSNIPLFFKFGAEVWILLRLDLISSVLVFVLAAMSSNQAFFSVENLAISLINVNSLTLIMNHIIPSAARMETEMVSIERLLEYSNKLPREDNLVLPLDPSPEVWPMSGTIIMQNMSASYDSTPDIRSLKDVSLLIESGTRVCVVGRTGSGKSTLLSALLRFVNVSGTLKIDGRDIKSVGLKTLRDCFEVIPQDPHLLAGTIRNWLDIHNQYTDAELWDTLDQVDLKEFFAFSPDGLDSLIMNGGENLSVGQCQLLYFARTLLRRPRIVLMDEATSSIDPETEIVLRKLIKNELEDATVVSVMHRLQPSVLDDYDKVLVMDKGRVAEFDTPRKLLENESSIFAALYKSGNS